MGEVLIPQLVFLELLQEQLLLQQVLGLLQQLLRLLLLP
jgi:hypothetical protein